MNNSTLRILTLAVAAGCTFGTTFAQDTKSADKTFLADSAQDSLAEINFAKLALQKSQDKNIREFATKMIKDHEMLVNSMKPFAAKLNAKVPSGPPLMDHVKYEELKLKSGTDFDRAYVELMVKDHHDDLKKFMDEENSTGDPSLKAAVAKGTTVIKKHTQMIDDIAHMGGIQTPPMPTE